MEILVVYSVIARFQAVQLKNRMDFAIHLLFEDRAEPMSFNIGRIAKIGI